MGTKMNGIPCRDYGAFSWLCPALSRSVLFRLRDTGRSLFCVLDTFFFGSGLGLIEIFTVDSKFNVSTGQDLGEGR